MNSMKKIILFTCLIGPVMPSHANPWENFKNSCHGLYTTCVQSLDNSFNAFSTSKFAQDTATKAVNLRNTTLRITAPVIDPVVAGAKTSANGISNAVQFTYEHPVIVGSGISVVAAAYLAYCKNSTARTAKENEVLAKAEEITAHLFDRDQVAFDKIAYWRYHSTDDKPAWMSAADIMANQADVYAALRLDFGTGAAQNDINFIDDLNAKIEESKKKFTPWLTKLKKALAKYYIMPSTRLMRDRQTNNYVSNLIKEYTGPHRAFINLTNDQIEAIDNKINSKISRSFINPAKIIRRTVFPDEAIVIEQYWNIYQLLQRLEALQAVVDNKRIEINGGLAAR